MAKSLFDAINDIVEIVRSSSDGHTNPWMEIVNHCQPSGTIKAQYCEPIEKAVEKYISEINDEDKRNIWLGTEFGQMDSDDVENIHITSIEMELQEVLFFETIDEAFAEAGYNRIED